MQQPYIMIAWVQLHAAVFSTGAGVLPFSHVHSMAHAAMQRRSKTWTKCIEWRAGYSAKPGTVKEATLADKRFSQSSVSGSQLLMNSAASLKAPKARQR